MENFKFELPLRKNFKELNSLCAVFNQMVAEGAKCEFALLDTGENLEPISYVSITFMLNNKRFLVLNRDLKRTISPDDLLGLKELKEYLSFGMLPCFSTDTDGTVLIISVEDALKSSRETILSSLSVLEEPDYSLSKVILDLNFVLCETNTYLKYLFKIANSMLLSGSSTISLPHTSEVKGDDSLILQLDVYLCHPERPSLQFFFALKNFSLRNVWSDISKFNFACFYHFPVALSCSVSGFTVTVSLYESLNSSYADIVNRQFEIIDKIALP